jgi:hypothetical protein
VEILRLRMADLFRANITKLNNDNYSVWKFKMELLLMKEDLWSQVSTKKPADTTAAASWQKRDDRARATIGLLVEDSQLIHIRKDTTAKGAWESLKNYHEKSTLTSKVYLLRQICNLKLSETGNMEQHVTTMQDLVDKLTALGEEIKDHLLVAMLLSSLPETYSTLITALESRPDTELTLGFVKGKLIDEYKRRKGVPDSEDSSTALRASQKKNSVGESDRSCFFCKKSGHFKQDCFKYKKWKANNEKREKVNEVKDKNERSGSVCFSVHDRKNQKDVWYIDSGATSHMSNDESFFKTLEKRKMRDVTVANGESAKVLGIGRGELHCLNGKDEAVKVCLENVLYVPDLTENLLSVKRLAKTGHSVGFTGEQCEISKNNIVIAKGKLSPDMYELTVPHRSLAVKQNQHTPNCQHSWHRRFGHRHPEDVQKLEIKKMATGLKIQDCGIREVCECCIKEKMSRCPIPKKATTRATSVLELVHTDLCGPMQNATPLDTGYLKIARDGKPMHNGEKFQKLIGAVLYVATHTRPDIAASVSILSQKIKQPTETDWNEAKRIVRYLKGTKEFKLKLTSNTEGLEAYTDADWAEDRTDSKSHSGFVFLYNGSAIAWACRKQTCTAWSSCEAEYIAIAEASRELLWIRRLLEDFHTEQTKPIRIYEDNQSAIKLIKTGESRNKTKHIDVKYHFVTDLEKKKIIEIRYCPTAEMIADMMTKPLGAVKLKKHREACQLMDLKRNIN